MKTFICNFVASIHKETLLIPRFFLNYRYIGQEKCLEIFFFPTLEGILERTAVLRAICAGFKESTEPPVCLSGGQLPSPSF